MKITCDQAADAAYIYLIDRIELGGVKETRPVEDASAVGQINLDYDANGRLVGIEILDASRKVPPELLRSAQLI